MKEPKVLKNSTQVGHVWLELEKICRKIQVRLYDMCDRESARRYRARLQRILAILPENDLAILREEGAALLHELRGEIAQAIKHRKKEIQLIERLHKSVGQSVENGDFDGKMGESILAGRNAATLTERRAILAALERQRDSNGGFNPGGIVRRHMIHRRSS